MIWIRKFEKDMNDADAKLIAVAYHKLKDSNKTKAEDLYFHYSEVIDAGNKAEKQVFNVINELLKDTAYSGVCNIRIDNTLFYEGIPAEFDCIMEDKRRVIYINIKKTDKYNNQPKQILRHKKILETLLSKLHCNKQLISIAVITSDPTSMDNLIKQLQQIKNDFKGRNDALCQYLNSQHSPIIHWYNISRQFNFTKDDFTKEGWQELQAYIKKVRPKKTNKNIICGQIIDVGNSSSGKTAYLSIKNYNGNKERVYLECNIDSIVRHIGKTFIAYPGTCEMYGSHPFIKNFVSNKYIYQNVVEGGTL